MKIQAQALTVGQTFSIPSLWSFDLPPVTYTAHAIERVLDMNSVPATELVMVLVDTTSPFVTSQWATFRPETTLEVK